MTARRELGDLAVLALPLCLGHLGQQLMFIVDAAMLGRFGDAALAGAGLSNNIAFAITVLGIGTIMGLDTLVPQALGAGEEARSRDLYSAGVRLALLLAVPISIAIAGIALLLPSTSIERGVAEAASANLFGRLPGVVPTLLFAAMRSYLQAHHLTRPFVMAIVIGNVINAVFAWLLIFGDGALERLGLPAIGLPPLGAFGAGLATSLVNFGLVAVCGAAIGRLHRGRPAGRSPGLGRAVVRLGAPVGLQLLAESGIFTVTGVLAGTLGRLPSAAHQVALLMASFSFSTAIGIGAATSVKVGHAIGAGDTRGARRAGAFGMAVGAGLMGIASIVFLLFPAELAGLFSDDEAVRSAATPLFRVAAIFQLSDAVQAVSAGALRGVGATRFTFGANLIGHYAVGFPVAILLGFWAGMGATGLWWGLSIGLTCVALSQSLRFRRLTSRPVRRAAPG